MIDILKLSKDEQQILFRNTAMQMGVHEAIIEKDYWVCLVLEYPSFESLMSSIKKLEDKINE